MDRDVRRRSTSPDVSCMIHASGRAYCIDPAGGLLKFLGRSWSLAVISVLGNRTRIRFNEIKDAIPGVGEKTLAERLREMVHLGLAEREVFPEVPVRVEYRLTMTGISLRNALVPLLAWAAASPSPPYRSDSPRPFARQRKTRNLRYSAKAGSRS